MAHESLALAAPFISGLIVLGASSFCQKRAIDALVEFILENAASESAPLLTRETELRPKLNLIFDRVQVVGTSAAILPGVVDLFNSRPVAGGLAVVASILLALIAYEYLDPSKLTAGDYGRLEVPIIRVSAFAVVVIAICVAGIALAFAE